MRERKRDIWGEKGFDVPHQPENYRRARTRGCFQEPPETGKAGALRGPEHTPVTWPAAIDVHRLFPVRLAPSLSRYMFSLAL